MSRLATRRVVAVCLAVLVLGVATAGPVAAAAGETTVGDRVDSTFEDPDDDRTDDSTDERPDDGESSNDGESSVGNDGTKSEERDEWESDDDEWRSNDDRSTADDDWRSDAGDAVEEVTESDLSEATADSYTTGQLLEGFEDVGSGTLLVIDASTGTITSVLTETGTVVDLDQASLSSGTTSATAAPSEQYALQGGEGNGPVDTGPGPSSEVAAVRNALVDPTGPTDGDDGGSTPLGAGGVALGLGVVAAAVAVRTTPMLAGSSSGGVGSTVRALVGSLLDRIEPVAFPLRYSRFDDSDPLEHEARERVFEVVTETPGSYLSEVSERADLPLSTTRHHVRVLEREDLVSGAKLRGKRRFYPAYAEGIELAAALSDEATASILDALSRLGPASVSDLAEELGRDPSTISHHLQRLEADAIVTREREGRSVLSRLTGEARTALEPGVTPKPGEARGGVAGSAD